MPTFHRFLWFAIYAVVASICLFQNFKPISKPILISIIILLVVYSAFHLSSLIDYLNSDNKNEIFGEMVYEKPHLEGTREFIGLLLAALAIFYQLKVKRR